MQLLVEISENDYTRIVDYYNSLEEGEIVNTLTSCVANGIPPPKGHGDLIDKNELPVDIFYDDIVKATVIIPPDSK